MKTKYKINIYCTMALSVIFSLFVQSCDSFEEEPLDVVSEEKLWQSADSTATYPIRYLYGIYTELPSLHNRLNNDYLDSGTDNGMPSMNKSNQGNVNAFRNNGISARNVVDVDTWGNCYEGIRRANVFLAHIDGAVTSAALAPMKPTWKAEVRFLRAFFYFELVKRWGGVPMLGDKVFWENDKIQIARSSVDACVTYILSELEAIEGDLFTAKGLADLNIGRITDGAAKALKSRVLLYMASPLYNTENSSVKWELAAKAAKDVMDMNVYSLHSSYTTLFTTIKNTESIFIKEAANSTTVETNNSPVGYQSLSHSCKGYTSPSQSLVDSYLTLDGKLITDAGSGYDDQDPFNNRDPRLKASIFYNGSPWLGRNVQTYEGGMDKPNGSTPQTKTGYYLRKFMGAFESSSVFGNTPHAFSIIRYAEILLNYAEALNEYDPSQKTEIEGALIKIRDRAGINAGSDGRYGLPTTYDQLEMRKIIQNERRIELAYEDHRFFDIRRWKTAETVMNQPIKGMKIVNTNGTLNYQVVEVEKSTFDKTRMYLSPIPQVEMYANPLLEQNPGWNY